MRSISAALTSKGVDGGLSRLQTTILAYPSDSELWHALARDRELAFVAMAYLRAYLRSDTTVPTPKIEKPVPIPAIVRIDPKKRQTQIKALASKAAERICRAYDFALPDGRALGNVRYGELRPLAKQYRSLAGLFDRLREQQQPPNDDVQIREMLSVARLSAVLAELGLS